MSRENEYKKQKIDAVKRWSWRKTQEKHKKRTKLLFVNPSEYKISNYGFDAKTVYTSNNLVPFLAAFFNLIPSIGLFSGLNPIANITSVANNSSMLFGEALTPNTLLSPLSLWLKHNVFTSNKSANFLIA